MSEDYKKIALEDVKEGQRVRIVERHSAHTITYEGGVLAASAERGVVHLGTREDWDMFYAGLGIVSDIFLLEDAPTDTVTFGNDGVAQLGLTMTVLPSGSVRVESDRGESFTFLTDMTHGGLTYFEDTGTLRFASIEHWERHEPRLRDKMLKDSEGYVWSYVDGTWMYWFKGGGSWEFDVPIEYYVKDGLTIVDSLD